MLPITAQRIADKARRLGAHEATVRPDAVAVCFEELDQHGREIGHACLEITPDVINLQDVRQVRNAHGVAWYRNVASKLHALDRTRAALVG